jgi:hypothetical protein
MLFAAIPCPCTCIPLPSPQLPIVSSRLAEAIAKKIIEAFQLHDLPRNSPNETIAGTAASAIAITPNAAILASVTCINDDGIKSATLVNQYED